MVGDKLIGQNEYGELFERKDYNGIKYIFIILQSFFDKAYKLHLNWYDKFKDKLRLDVSEEILNYSDDNCKRYNHKSFLLGLDVLNNIKINIENIMFSYENIILPKDCNLRFADLCDAHLGGVSLINAHLEYADLSEACLENACLADAYLNGAKLWNTHLVEAYFERAHLEGVILSGSNLKCAVLKNTNMKSAVLSNAHLEGVDLCDAHLEGADLSKSHLEGADLSESHLEGANLCDAHLEGANLSKSHLEGTNLWIAHFECAILKEAHLEGVDLAFADSRNADLSNAILYSESLKNTDPETQKVEDRNRYQHIYVNFQGAKLYNVDLSHIQGLTASQIAGADLTSAKLPQNLDNLTEVTKPVNEAIRSNGTLFTAIMIILTIIFLFALSLPNDFILTQIPISGVGIKISRSMLWVAPVALYIMFLSFCINLSSFWNILGNLPAIFPDGRKLPEVIDQWSPTSWVYLSFNKLKKDKPDKEPILKRIKKFVSDEEFRDSEYKRIIELISNKKSISACIKNFISDKEISIRIQAIFSYLILYVPIPALIIYICVKFNIYHSIYCNRDSVVSWLFTILTILTLAYYSYHMKKSLDK